MRAAKQQHAYLPRLNRARTAAASSPQEAAKPLTRVHGLQRAAGNQAVHRLLNSCVIQPKHTVGPADDEYEREADRVADDVLRMPASPPAIERASHSVQRECQTCESADSESAVSGHIRRKCAACAQEEEERSEDERRVQAKRADATTPDVTSDVDAYLRSSGGRGRPLDPDTRSEFEARFGHDFEQVRVHDDAAAAASARTLNARAYTFGHNIVFGSGEFAPATSEGRRLLSHELTHVVQQSGVAALQRQPSGLTRVGKILSLKEIRSDPKREKARKATGQASARVCKSISEGTGKGNCPATLEPGLRVTIVGEKAGGTWLEIVTPEQVPGFGPKEPIYVIAAFVEEDPAAAVPKATGPAIKDITRLDQTVPIKGLPHKQPNYIDFAIGRLESAPLGPDITLFPKTGGASQNGISIPKGDFYIDTDPLSGFALGQMQVYKSRDVAEAVIKDLMNQAPDTPAFAYYLQDGIILPTTLSATTIPNLLPHIRDKRDQDFKDLQATADLAKAVAWWYVGARFPIKISSGGPTAKEALKQLEKEAAKRAEREAAKEAAKQAEKEAAKKAEREAAKQAGKRTPAVQPSAPAGWKGTLNDFGQKVGWPVGGQTRIAAEAADLAKLRNMGVTEQWASAQGQIYREVAKLNRSNPTAVLRAEWLEKIAARLRGAP